jgi:hypothetical protein
LKKQLQFSMFELANMLKIQNKRAIIDYFKPLSLYLQKEIVQRNISLEQRIDRSSYISGIGIFNYYNLISLDNLPVYT